MKTKLIILLFCFSSSWSLAQDTVKLPTRIAKAVIRDLIDYDEKKAIFPLYEGQIKLLEKKVVVKDSVISVFNLKEANYLQQIDAEKAKAVIWQQQYQDMRKMYRKEKALRKVEKGIFAAILGGLGYFYIKK